MRETVIKAGINVSCMCTALKWWESITSWKLIVNSITEMGLEDESEQQDSSFMDQFWKGILYIRPSESINMPVKSGHMGEKGWQH